MHSLNPSKSAYSSEYFKSSGLDDAINLLTCVCDNSKIEVQTPNTSFVETIYATAVLGDCGRLSESLCFSVVSQCLVLQNFCRLLSLTETVVMQHKENKSATQLNATKRVQ